MWLRSFLATLTWGGVVDRQFCCRITPDHRWVRCETQPSEHVRVVQLPSGGPSIQTQLTLLASEPVQTEGKSSPWRMVRLPSSLLALGLASLRLQAARVLAVRRR